MLTDWPAPFALLIAALGLVGGATAQEEGQYRSRILLDPVGELGRGSELSTEELEQQIDSIREPYARSSATRHLARHYLQQGDYDSAISWYREALAAGGLSEVANREMLRELAQALLLAGQNGEAVTVLEQALAIDLVPDAGDFLLLAQAHYRLEDYVAVVDALDRLQAAGFELDSDQLRQALALYYRAGAFAQCEPLLGRLLAREPEEASHWHQLASVHLQQNERRQARDRLVLARDKGIAFTPAELMLLVDLLAVTGNPYGGAQLLEEAMAAGELPGDADNQRKLFELWLQARERERAREALARAAQVSGDTELYLYLAQLHMEDEAWPAMQETVLAACEQELADRHVSRANLLLGISLLKQDRPVAARRALINATLIGGAQSRAAEWLTFMQAAPTSEDEARRVVGPCHSSGGRRGSLAGDADVAATSEVAPAGESAAQKDGATMTTAAVDTAAVDAIAVKTVPPQTFYTTERDQPLTELAAQLEGLAVRLNVTLVKSGGTADGPLHVLLAPDRPPRLGLPVKGVVQARGRFRLWDAPALRCAWRSFAPGDGLQARLENFIEQVRAAGHEPTGEVRLVISGGAAAGIEAQVGLR